MVKVIGGGLAGCEAAWALASRGIPVVLYEMKPLRFSPAHTKTGLCELVCSNSLKASRLGSASGLLKAEMRRLGSFLLPIAEECAVPAGGALAVDRDLFSEKITRAVEENPLITLCREPVDRFDPSEPTIVATGPLTDGVLASFLQENLIGTRLSFYDAAAPIVTRESLDFDRVFLAARYGRGDDDYINCPFDRESYRRFYDALISAESVPLEEVDRQFFKVYEGCMPVEVLAKRGEDAIRYGPLKPVGLTDPRTGKRPWAVVQLRRENAEGSLYNLVGFQTNLRFGEQQRVFSMIPGLENAQFVRYGVMHRNTFLDSPRLLNADQSLRSHPNTFFAGQMTGVEGYMESAASGLLAGIQMARRLAGQTPLCLPRDTMLGALTSYITDPNVPDFQPMGANMGILPPPEKRIRDKQERYELLAERSLRSLESYLQTI